MTALKTIKFPIVRSESNFDKACDQAWYQAINRFGIDEDGHSSLLLKWERNCCSINVTFVKLSFNNNEFVYEFEAAALKEE